MFIYGIYRLDHMRLRIKLFQFLTSVMDIQEDTVQDSFLKRRQLDMEFVMMEKRDYHIYIKQVIVSHGTLTV